jgi:phage-related protein
MDFEIQFFRTASGRSPVDEFLDTTRRKQPRLHKLAIAGLGKLRNPSQHRSPLVKKIDSDHDIWELRIGGANTLRLFYFYAADQLIVVTSGYVKKSQKLDKNQIETARMRKREWLERHHD